MLPVFATSTTVFNKLVEHYRVSDSPGNPIKIESLTVIAPNEFLLDAFDECDEAPIQKAIAFTDELQSENKSAGPNAVDATGS